MPIKRKRVRISVDEKIWILNHRKENPLISQNKIALDFLAKFKKTVDRTCVTKFLQKNDQRLAFSKADPELERKRIKNFSTITKVEVAPLTFILDLTNVYILNIEVTPKTAHFEAELEAELQKIYKIARKASSSVLYYTIFQKKINDSLND